MNDIDFDELDKAVNSVLVDDTSSSEGVSTPEPASATAPQPAPAPISSPADRRAKGRFMDVVHPSSDMRSRARPATVRPMTPEPVIIEQSQQSVSPSDGSQPAESEADAWLRSVDEVAPEPHAVDVTDEVIAVDAVVTMIESETETFGAAPVPDEASASDDLGADISSDRNDEASVTAEAFVEAPDETEVETEIEAETETAVETETDAPTLDDETDSDAQSAMETPFMSAIPVEKRPLGAFSNTPAPAPDTDDSASHDDIMPDPLDIMTDALSDDTSHDEPSDMSDEDIDTLAALETETPIETPAEAPLQADAPAETAPVEAPAPTPAPEQPARRANTDGSSAPISGSIPMQYSEKTSSANDDSTPIYDTNDYHRPLQYTPKARSGWLTVVIIVGLIVLGVGAGAAFYLFDPFGVL